MSKALLIMICLLQESCLSRLREFSMRRMNAINGTQVLSEKTSIEDPLYTEDRESIYLKKKIQHLELAKKDSDSGSLFFAESPYIDPFSAYIKPKIGQIFDVDVVLNKKLQKDEKKEDQLSKIDPEKNQTGSSDLAQALENIHPQIYPKDQTKKDLITSFKAKAVHVFNNGDILVSYERFSKEDMDAKPRKTIELLARVSESSLKKYQRLKTTDLFDIQLNDLSLDEKFIRSSSNWEDEYTLRLSLFSEAESKEAFELKEERRKLDEIKDQLKSRIDTFSKEKSDFEKVLEKQREKNQNSPQTSETGQQLQQDQAAAQTEPPAEAVKQ